MPDDSARARAALPARASTATSRRTTAPTSRRTLQAYALYVRALAGRRGPRAGAGARARGRRSTKLSLEALGWLLPLLGRDAASQAEAAAIRRRIANRVTETAGAAHFAASYGDGAYLLLHSDRRVDAIMLEALIADQPKSDLIPKLVAGLLAHRKAGRWANTQENAFVLLALDRYFAAYEKATPDFVARVWLGERYAGAHAFHGRTTERQHTSRSRWPCSTRRARPATSLLVEGGRRPALLPHRHALRAAEPDARRRRPRLRRRAPLRRRRPARATSRATRTARGTSRPARACACG